MVHVSGVYVCVLCEQSWIQGGGEEAAGVYPHPPSKVHKIMQYVHVEKQRFWGA